MSLKTEKDLSAATRGLVNRARQAGQSKNTDYAITLWQTILKEEPLYLDGRRELRVIEIQKYNALSTFGKQMLKTNIASVAMKLSAVAKKEPLEQLPVAEEVLAIDPFNVKANTMIGDAGNALGYAEFVAFGYETIAQGKPDDKASLNALAQAYMKLQLFEKAEKTFNRILEIDPRDGDALSGLKNASAANASKTGGWEAAEKEGDFRGALKNKDESDQLEQESKVVKSTEAIDRQIQLLYEKHQAEPTNPAHSKAIAQLFVQKNDYTNAIPFYQHAYESGGKIDSSLEKIIGDLKLKKTGQELQHLRTALAEQTDPDGQAQYQAALEEKEKELNQVRLELAEARVKAQPNEGEFRYDLGLALYKIGQYKRSVEELQQSLKQPSVRYQALNLMGQAFMKRNMLDFAVKQLSLAKSELLGMDEVKKEIVYNLGLAYEATKQADKALDQFKEIYEHDMSYRDVAKRVEDSYEQGDQTA